MTSDKPDLKFVFDMAGVLVEWDSDVLFDPLFEKSTKSKEVFFRDVLNDAVQTEISAGKPMDKLLSSLQDSHPQWREEIATYWDRWDEMVVGEMGGTVSVVSELKERGHQVYILGNWGSEEFERAKPRFSFLELFDDVLLSGYCGILKPDPRIYELAENQFSLVAEKTVFIDDKAENVEAAIERNWNGIVFENPRQLYLVLMDYGIL